jgi:PAS domain S-box-containing protein
MHVIDEIPALHAFIYKIDTGMGTDRLKSLMSRNNDEKQTHAILEAANDGVIICNNQGIIIELNSSAKTMFGNMVESDIVGRLLMDLFVESRAMGNILRDLPTINRGVTQEFNGIKKNGERFPVRVSTMYGKLGNMNVITAFCTDVTLEHKQRELLSIEKHNNEKLLLSILPGPIAIRLKRGDANIADRFDSVTCFFSDMVGFTKMSSEMSASELVEMLNRIVTCMDDRATYHGMEKIKTIGDAYFCVGGLNGGDSISHASAAVRFAIDTLEVVSQLTHGQVSVRIGIHTGPLVAGVIGRTKFAYDCWGDTVNLASRMESTGVPGRIQVSRQTYECIHDIFLFEERYNVEVKGKGSMSTFLVIVRDEDRRGGDIHVDRIMEQNPSIVASVITPFSPSPVPQIATAPHENGNLTTRTDASDSRVPTPSHRGSPSSPNRRLSVDDSPRNGKSTLDSPRARSVTNPHPKINSISHEEVVVLEDVIENDDANK